MRCGYNRLPQLLLEMRTEVRNPPTMKKKRNRPDLEGKEQGIYKHNRKILRTTATVCALCGMPIDKSLRYPNPMSISIDHIIPVALGGKSTIDNLQATHLICNKVKGKKILAKSKEDYQTPTREKVIPQYIDWSNYDG